MLSLLNIDPNNINRHHQLIQFPGEQPEWRGQQTRINDRRNRLHPVDQFVLNGVIKAQRATQKRDNDGQPR